MVKCHCGKNASFNVRGEKKGLFCVSHKTPEMVDVVNRSCECDGCDTHPTFNLPGEKKGRFCALHKSPDMIDVITKTCEVDGCDTQSIYNLPGEKKGRFCALHKTPDMVDIKNRTCEVDGCDIMPTYNLPGEKNGRLCVLHKTPDMIDVKHKTCEVGGCDIRPTYNLRGEKNGSFCVLHKTPDMVNVKNKVCEASNCDTQPIFNLPGEKKGRFCALHKSPDMINVRHKTCDIDGCTTIPVFNDPGKKKGRLCSLHKSPEMVNVVSPFCEEKSCSTTAMYGLLGQKQSHCAQHKEKGMIPYPRQRCSQCRQLGTHEADSASYCPDHAPPNADNLGIQPCSVCGLDDVLIQGKCETCRPEIVQLRQHAKENRICDILTVAGIPFTHDKMLEGPQCGRERPDFQIDCGTHFVYVEVDENQHRGYACECEQTRMVNLVHARGMPVKWIRYNPDMYHPTHKQPVWAQERREKKLLEYIHYAMKHTPQEDGCISHILYLFYDDYDTMKQEWLKLI